MAQSVAKRCLLSGELRGKRSGEVSWRQTVLASGTLADKMAALTLMVQDSPLHSLASLDSLVAMAGKKGKREALLAVGQSKFRPKL